MEEKTLNGTLVIENLPTQMKKEYDKGDRFWSRLKVRMVKRAGYSIFKGILSRMVQVSELLSFSRVVL